MDSVHMPPPLLPSTLDEDDDAMGPIVTSYRSMGSLDSVSAKSLKSLRSVTFEDNCDDETSTERTFMSMTGRHSSRKSAKRSVLEPRETPFSVLQCFEGHAFKSDSWKSRCFDRENWPQDLKLFATRLTDSIKFVAVTMVLTLFALFADDFRVAVTSKPWDPFFDSMTIVCILVFSLEIVATCLAKRDYIGSFFFWLDFFPTLTLILDLTFVADALFCSSVDSGSALKSGRAGRAGARAGRTVRIIRLVRLVKVYKLYSKAVETRDRNRAIRASLAPPPGEFGGHLLEDDPAAVDAMSVSSSTVRGSVASSPGTKSRGRQAEMSRTSFVPFKGSLRHSLTVTNLRKTLIGENKKKDPFADKETRVGKKLSDMTTRRVIVIVLIMLFGLPLFLPETHGYDELKSSPSIAIEFIFNKWSNWCPMDVADPHGLPSCLGDSFFNSGGSGLILNQVSDVVAEARYWYERYLLSFLYLHHDSPFAWKLRWIGFQSKRLNELLGNDKAGERLGAIAQLSQTILLRDNSLPPAVWDQTFANDNWVNYVSKLSENLKHRLTQPWTQKCMTSFFGVSIVSEPLVECMPDSLRCTEMQYFAPLARKENDSEDLQFVFAFDKRPTMKLEAALSMIQTTFICISIALGAFAFAMDANKMLLKPVAIMMSKMETIKDKPTDAMHFGDREYRRQQVQRKERREEYMAGGRCWRCWYRFRHKRHQEPRETVILERTIIKLGSMLSTCFGESGGQAIGKYITQDVLDGADSSGSTVDILVGGEKVDVIVGSCAIRDLMRTSIELDGKVVLFVNRVFEVVHEIVNDFSGFPGKSTGQSFSLSWRLTSKDSSTNRKMADMSIMAVVKIIAAVSTSNQLSSYRGQEGLLSQIGHVQIHMDFGLHMGWAIESVIGSDILIDTAFLSPHMQVTRGLQAATAHYNVQFLLSQAVVLSCNHAMASQCRLIDQVVFHPNGRPVRIYCVDLDTSHLSSETFCEFGTAAVAKGTFRLRQKREISKSQKWTPTVIMSESFGMDDDVSLMRARYTPEFFKRFFTAYRNYECGEWMVARDMLFTCEYSPNYHVPPIDVSEKDWPMDGPTRALLRFMRQYDYHPPEDWLGFREFPLPRMESTASMPPSAFLCERGLGRTASSYVEAEKHRLDHLIHIFGQNALQGSPCTYLKERTHERCDARYVIDTSLEHLVVTLDGDGGVEVVIPISSIVNAYSIERDGEAVFPPELLNELSVDDRETLLMVVYRNFDQEDQNTRLCLLERSGGACDRFVEGIRIWHVYAEKMHQNGVSAFQPQLLS